MITTGIWCDECRRKYVRHLCKNNTLPCRHSYEAAIGVWYQAYRRGGEHVEMEWGPIDNPRHENVWLHKGDNPRRNFIGDDSFEFWGMRVHPWRDYDAEMWVGEWLACKPDAFVRAFLKRWDSSNYIPSWQSFREHPYAKRACA